jgi:hypothetical protein
MSAAPKKDELAERLIDEVHADASKKRKGRKGKKNGHFDWLRKASFTAVLAWLVDEIPRDSIQRARSALKRLLEQVEEEVPEATVAIATMGDILRRLEATPDPRPWQTTPGDLLTVTVATWEKIANWRSEEDPDRFLASFGDAVVRLERGDSGQITAMTLDSKRMINMLSHVARWTREPDPMLQAMVEDLAEMFGNAAVAELLYQAQAPPQTVAQNLLAEARRPLPVLERVVEFPVLAPNGSVHDAAGYDPSSRCFLSPAPGLEVPPVPEHPAINDITRARELIAFELFGQFPFVSDAELAHAVCLLVEQFVRVLIDGPTPMYLIEAPTPGTGKGLLLDAAASPALGRRKVPKMAEGRDPDEWRKRLTAKLRAAPPFTAIDNLTRPLDSGALAMVITAGEVEDRLLGVSEVVTLPVRCTLAATANNPRISDEMARRVARIRLDAGVEFPERRGGWRHPDLLGWAYSKRGDLIWAALTLARAWVAAGRPDNGATLGGFESWAQVMGGILNIAGIDGFLGNIEELRDETQDSTHGDFLHTVFKQRGNREWAARDVLPIARAILSLGDVADNVAAQRLGTKLRSMRDRPTRGLVLRSPAGSHGHVRVWRVMEAADHSPHPPQAPRQARNAGGSAEERAGIPPAAPPQPPRQEPLDLAVSGGRGGTGGTGGADPAVDEPTGPFTQATAEQEAEVERLRQKWGEEEE